MSNSTNVINHNMLSMFSNRQLGITETNLSKSTEKLSSGYKVNRSADDAACLSISEAMRKSIRGLNQGSYNIQDGISLVQTADGYLDEVHNMLQRINELTIKGANGTLSDSDRSNINDEVQQLKNEMHRIFTTAKFNEFDLFRIRGVTMDPESSAAGRVASTFTNSKGVTYKAAARLDFSGVDFKNLGALNNSYFGSSCCTCNDKYTIIFDTSTASHSRSGLNFTVGINGCTNAKDLVDCIVKATNGNPGGHYTNYVADPGDPTGSTLLIYDKRPDQIAKAPYGAIEEDMVTDNGNRELWIQTSSKEGHGLMITWTALSNGTIGITPVNTLNQGSSFDSIALTKRAIEIVSETRSQFGAYQNRLEHALKNNNNISENTQASESLIRDTDMASEMVNFSKSKVIQQAGQSMLSQANHLPESTLSLLQ